MHYFTRELANGELRGGDDEEDALRAAYDARLSEVETSLPPDLLRFTKQYNLHDGLIESVCWCPQRRELALSLVFGNLQLGYHAAKLRYGRALLGPGRIETLRRVAESRETEILFDEVDRVGAGLFAHRFLFAPSEQLTLEFETFTVEVEARSDKRVNLLHPFLIDEDEDP